MAPLTVQMNILWLGKIKSGKEISVPIIPSATWFAARPIPDVALLEVC